MNRLSKLAARYVGEQGFSIGITDVTPAAELLDEKEATLASSYGVCARLVRDFNAGELELLPGCDADESLEVRWAVLSVSPFCSVFDARSVFPSVFNDQKTMPFCWRTLRCAA